MEYKIQSSNEELYHYGIRGMKWGIRRYQNKDGTLTAKGKERYHDTKSGMSAFAGMLESGVNAPPEYKADSFREVLVRKDGQTSDYEYALSPNNRVQRFRKEYIDDPDSVFEKHMAKVNTTRGEESGTFNNCTKTSSAMVLARMGYDYDAGRSKIGHSGAFEYWFDGAKKSTHDDLASAIDEKFSDTANGSFGTVDLRNKNGGGHVFNWERNSKGEFNLYESQCKEGEKISGSSPKECFDKYIEKRPWFSSESTVRVYDMTSAQPNFNHMAEDSVVRITDDSRYGSYILDTNTKKLYEQL